MRSRPLRASATLAVVLGCVLPPPWALAQSTEVVPLSPVVVTATRNPIDIMQAPAAATLVTREQMDLREIYRLGDALEGVPGLYLRGSAFGSAFPASGVGAITLRGIPRTPRTLVLLDGQPLNNALSGGVNLSGIPMEDIDRIEVVRGPFSALYGGHAMGGVIQLLTRAPARREVSATVGYGDGELPRRGFSLVYKDRLESGLGLTLATSYRRSDGWDDSDSVVSTPGSGNGTVPVTGAERTSTVDGRTAWLVGDKGARPWEQYNAGLTLNYDVASGTSVAGGLAWSKYRVGATPPRSRLRDASGREVLSGNVSPIDDPSARLALLASDFLTQTPSGEEDWRAFARAEVALSPRVQLRASVGWLDHALRFPQPSATAGYASGSGEFFDQPNQRGDADVHARIAVTDALHVVTGASLNRNRLDRTNWQLAYWRDEDSRVGKTSGSEGTTWNVAAYAEAQWLATRWLAIYAGTRYDRFSTRGRIEQLTPPAFAQDVPRRSEDQLSPKVAAVASLGRDTTLRLSYGEGFRAPTLLDLYSRSVAPGASAGAAVVTEPSPDLAPERVRSVELGLDTSLPGQGRAALSLFTQRLTDLIYRQRVSPVRNVVVNAGEARVDGAEVELSLPLLDDRLRFHATATHLFRYEITRNDAVPASVGKHLTDVPQSLYTASLEGRLHGWSGSLSWRHASHIFGSGDDLNRNTVQGVFGSYDRYGVVGVKLARELWPGVTASIAIDNLANAQYFQFYKQPGRSVYFEVALRR